MRDVFTYTSYRELLKDYYEARKAESPSFSYHKFAEKAGLTAKTYLIQVINGQKRLSRKSLFNLAGAMGLNKRETDFFEALVMFSNAESISEREHGWERLKAITGKTGAAKIGSGQFDYFSQWYHPAVRELVAMNGFSGGFEKLARRLKPRISTKQARESVQLLLNLGLIKKSSSGKYQQINTQISTGDELFSLAVMKHQQKVLELGVEALERFPVQDRDISTISAGISKGCFKTVKREIQLFRKRLLGIMEDDKHPDMVYQLNFQLFPLTEPPSQE